MRRLLAAAALCLALAGCGAAPQPPPPTPPPPAAAVPVSLDIPAIDVHRPVEPTGLNPDGTIDVPPLDKPLEVDWYQYSPPPGEVGPSVLLSHVNAYGTPGAFARLHELDPGDVVQVERSDQSQAQFRVTTVNTVPKADFPSEKVYGDTPDPELRLITCGGALDRVHHSYESNVIVSAVLED